jgi:hypothetical protein
MTDTTMLIVSTTMASILAAYVIIKDDISLLIAAMIVSPISGIINKTTIDVIESNYQIAASDIYLLFLTILCAIVVGFMIGLGHTDLSGNRIKRFSDTDMGYYVIIGLTLGMFNAYILNMLKDTNTAINLVGISIAITLLPPMVDMGLRLGQPSLQNSIILNDFHIIVANVLSFAAGSFGVNYFMRKY